MALIMDKENTINAQQTLVHEIKEMLSRDWRAEVQHILREGLNVQTDWQEVLLTKR